MPKQLSLRRLLLQRRIPCEIRNAKFLIELRRVMGAICERYPDDFRRVTNLVTGIGWDPSDNYLGQWVMSGETARVGWSQNQLSTEADLRDSRLGTGLQVVAGHRGEIVFDPKLVSKPYSETVIRALIAHELGHAASTREDLEQQGSVRFNRYGYSPGLLAFLATGELLKMAMELCADKYVAKWGFEADLIAINQSGECAPFLVPGSQRLVPLAVRGSFLHVKVTAKYELQILQQPYRVDLFYPSHKHRKLRLKRWITQAST